MAIITIYTKLLNKTLDGGRIIDLGSTKSCECYVLPRDSIYEIGKKHNHLHQYSFYILLGADTNGQPMVYIGQTNDFVVRSVDHKQKKQFWNEALVFVSKSNELFAGEVLYLEYLGWKIAKDANNYIIENTKELNMPHLSADKKDEMELFFEDIRFLTRFYGCKVFDNNIVRTTQQTTITHENFVDLYMRLAKTWMKAKLLFHKESKRYIIAAGSTIIKQTGDSCSKGMKDFRNQIIENRNYCQEIGELSRLLQDIEIPETLSSPSGAASFCAGTSRQGTNDWKDIDGNIYFSA